jgi:hypothetical protein
MTNKIQQLKAAAQEAKQASLFEKAEKVGQVVDVLIEVLIEMDAEIQQLKAERGTHEQ